MVAFRIEGRVIDRASRRGLEGRTVEAWGGSGPTLLGQDVTAHDGAFEISVSERDARRTFGDADASASLRVKSGDGEAVTAGAWSAAEPRTLIELEIDVPVSETSRAIDTIELPLSRRAKSALVSRLRTRDVRTLSEVRTSLGIPDAHLSRDERAAEDLLAAHARLEVAGVDPGLSSRLVNAGITNLADLARTPLAEIAERSSSDVGELLPLQRKARAFRSLARVAFAENIIAAAPANARLGRDFRAPERDADTTGIGDAISLPPTPDPDSCQTCAHCASAISPAAYLIDLLDFLIDNFKTQAFQSASTVTPKGFSNLKAIEDRFRRPFGKLVVDCEESDESVRQIEIAIEVLEKFITTPPVSGYSRELVYGYFDLLDVRNRPIYPKPDILSRMFDAYLEELGITRTGFDAAVKAAFPSGATAPDKTLLNELLADLGVDEAQLKTKLGLAANWKVTIKALDAMPEIVRKAKTKDLDPADVTQISAWSDALERANAATARVKEYALADIRANLIAYALRQVNVPAVPALSIKTPKQLADYLHIDLTVDVCARTTRLADAIGAIQSWVEAFRFGLEDPGYFMMFAGGTDDVSFSARWKWMRSYSIWQAAQSVFLYPENFLMSELRHDKSTEFDELLKALDDSAGSESFVTAAVEAYRASVRRISIAAAKNLYAHASDATGIGLETFRNLQQLEYERVGANDPVRRYLDEWYFYAPLAVAETFNRAQLYERATDWLNTVYFPHEGNYPQDFPFRPVRLVWLGFSTARESSYSYRNTGQWQRDPFSPFAIAGVRTNAFVRHVVIRHVENLLDWADAEFVRDTPESISRARELYELAATVMAAPEIAPEDECRVAWRQLLNSLAERFTAAEMRDTLMLLMPITQLRARVKKSDIKKISDVLLGSGAFAANLAAVKQLVDAIAARLRVMKSIEETMQEQAECQVKEVLIEDLYHRSTEGNVLVGGATPAAAASGEMEVLHRAASRIGCGFCVPANPLLSTFRYRISSNLEKIRTCRNFAGLRRNVRAYAAAADPVKVVQAAASGEDFDTAVPSEPPPVHRFSYLIERARYYADVARQFEAQLLNAFQQEDAEQYSLMKAKQDLRLGEQAVILQNLRVVEATDGVTLAQHQRDRASSQLQHFQDLLQTGLNSYEQEALENMWKAHDWGIAAVVANTANAAFSGAMGAVVGGGAAIATGAILGGAAALTQGMSNLASLYAQARSMQASFERRREEWQLQVTLSTWDQQIGEQGIVVANDRLQITGQEREIAVIQQEVGRQVVEFLGTKFTGVRLWQWMGRVLRRYYRDHINFAAVTARMAQRALEFERQQPLSYISTQYSNSEQRDLLVAEQLLTDINKLDQHRLITDKRRKELTKTISLAQLDPVEFARLRQEGWMTFVTPMSLFDRDFPGHYMRLIKNVSMTVIALVPPGDPIHATVSNSGVSRVMVGEPFEQAREITRQPETIAVSVPSNGTGLFDLRLEDPILLPFEGAGVETTWTLEMPLGANSFSFETLVDVLFTIRYTALEDVSYRQKALKQMGANANGDLPTAGMLSFPVRTTFSDEWYDLHNPQFVSDASTYGFAAGQTKAPYTMAFDIRRSDFPPNEQGHAMSRGIFAFRQNTIVNVPMEIIYRPVGSTMEYRVRGDHDWDTGNPASGPLTIATFAQRRTVGAATWTAVVTPLSTLSPFGRWIVRIRNEDAALALVEKQQYGQNVLKLDWLRDLTVVIVYNATAMYRFAA